MTSVYFNKGCDGKKYVSYANRELSDGARQYTGNRITHP